MYAEGRGWALDFIGWVVGHWRPDGGGGAELIEISLSFTGELSDEQRGRLKEIADVCPVQKTIFGGLMVESVLEG